MPFPGGPKIEAAAKGGTLIELPYSIKGMDVSFSGMQTKLQQLFNKGEKVDNGILFELANSEGGYDKLLESAQQETLDVSGSGKPGERAMYFDGWDNGKIINVNGKVFKVLSKEK